MEITVNVKSFSETLGKLRKVCPRAVDFNILPGKRGITLSALADDVAVKFKLHNATVDEPGDPITVPLDPILGVIKGRTTLTFKYENDTLVFTDGEKYSGKIEVPEYQEIDLSKPSDGLEINLSDSEASAVFYQAVEDATLTGAFSQAENMNLLLKMGKKGLIALCFDSYYTVKVIDSGAKYEDLQAALDLSIIATIQGVVGKGESYSMTITDSSVYAYSQDFLLRFPAIQVESIDDSISNMDSFIGRWLKSKCSRVWVETTKLKEVLANISSFHQTGVPIDFTLSTKGLTIGIKSATGQMKESIPAKVENPEKEPFHCEYKLISELLDKVTVDTTPLSFIKDSLVYIHTNDDVREFFAGAALRAQ